MHKCDSCGKVVVNEQDYMCPHCGAVTKKHCDHQKHLPDDKYNRANDYRTASSEHKSKTYDYEKAPKTDNNQKFDINDLANIKNAEDAKRIAKKAFVEQDQNGRKKFKPLAIVLIIIFAVNILGNLLGVVGDVIDDAFSELEYAFESIDNPDYTLGEETLIHKISAVSCVNGVTFDRVNDCLTIDLSDIYFEYTGTSNEDYEVVEDEWQSDFSYPSEYFFSGDAIAEIVIYNEKEIQIPESFEDSYEKKISLLAEISDTGELKVYGLNSHLRNLEGQAVYCELYGIIVDNYNSDTNEKFDCSVYLPFGFIKILPDSSVEFYEIYESYTDEDKMEIYKNDLSDQYVPDEYVEHIEFGDTDAHNNNIFESIPASATYTEMVTLVD